MSTACRLLQNMSCPSPWWRLTVHPAATVLPSGPRLPAPSPAALAFFMARLSCRPPSSLIPFLLFLESSTDSEPVTRGTGQVIIPQWAHLSPRWLLCISTPLSPWRFRSELWCVLRLFPPPLLLDSSGLNNGHQRHGLCHRVLTSTSAASCLVAHSADADFLVIGWVRTGCLGWACY